MNTLIIIVSAIAMVALLIVAAFMDLRRASGRRRARADFQRQFKEGDIDPINKGYQFELENGDLYRSGNGISWYRVDGHELDWEYEKILHSRVEANKFFGENND